MKRILAVILALSMLTVCVGASLAEEGPMVKITEADGTETTVAFTSDVFRAHPDAVQFEITGNVSENIDFRNDKAKLIVNGEVKGGLYAEGEKNSIAITGNIVTTENNGIQTENGWDSEEKKVIPNSSTITVDGDVTAVSTDHDSWSDGIDAVGNSDITVGGDVSADYVGVSATDNSTVTVGGDVKAGFEKTVKDGDYEYTYTEGYGIRAGEEATVTVKGDVVSDGEVAVSTYNKTYWEGDKRVVEATKATITVDGGLISNHGDGITARGESTITVGKNEDGIGVKAYGDGIEVYDQATVTVDGDVKAGHEEKGKGPGGSEYTTYSGHGIYALASNDDIEPTVVVNGNVESESTAISTQVYGKYDPETEVYSEYTNKADITVNGDVTSKHGDAVRAVSETTVTVKGDINAYETGVNAQKEAIVTIDGDITAGHKESGKYSDGTEYTYYTGNGIAANGDATVTVTGDIESEGTAISTGNSGHSDPETGKWVVDPSKATVAVEGDVISKHSGGIYAEGNSEITVGGNVEAEGQGIHTETYYYSEWDKETDKTTYIPVENMATVIVNGDVTSTKMEAIDMEAPNSTIKVWGDVNGGDFVPEESEGGSSSGEDEPIDPREEAYWEAYNEAYSAKWDELFGEYADRFDDDYYEGAIAISSAEEANGQLIVGGTVTAQGESVPVVINLALDPDKKGEIPELEKALPDMKIYEIAPNDGEYFQVNAFLYKDDVEFSFEFEGEEIKQSEDMGTACLGGEERAELVETLAKTIQYIIKVIDPANGQINLDGVTYDEENNLMLAHEGDNITVRVGAGNGYRVTGVDAGNIAELTRNPDGTWTVTVKRGGGVTISATIERVSSKRHPALNQTILFGHYDVNGDGTAEELAWLCTKVSGSYAKLALIEGFEEKVPEDFATAAFNEDEMGSIKDGAVTEMAAKEAKYRFKDEKIHPVINVKLSSIGY